LAEYFRDETEDISMCEALALHEWRMFAHFSPTWVILIATILWSFRWTVLEWTIKIGLALSIAIWWEPLRWAEQFKIERISIEYWIRSLSRDYNTRTLCLVDR